MASSLHLVLALSSLLVTLVSTGMPGAPVPADPASRDIQKAANFALERFNRMSNDAHIYRKIKVLSAKSQVVAGVNYYLTMKIGATNCRKNSENLEACELAQNDEAQTRICTFQVYSIPWKNTMSLEDSNCEAV
uniref:Cystatin-like n=1 Tax=Xenopus tropicalis TaxID=8364 RepID=A0A803K2R8_XENTR